MNKLFSKIATLSVGLAMAVGVGVALGQRGVQKVNAVTQTGTINFGNASGSTKIDNTSVSGDDSLDNTWTVTTVFSGTQSFTQNASYSQVGASGKPATSITFTTTLAASRTITAFSAKFGGFSGTAGTITLKVGETSVGTGNLNASTDVTVNNSSQAAGTVLTVTVDNTSTKGIKVYYISYTYDDGAAPTKAFNITGVTADGLYLKNESYDIGYEASGFDTEPTITNVVWTVPSGAGSIADGKWATGATATENVKLELDLKANGDDYHAEVTTNIDQVTALEKYYPKTKFSVDEAFVVNNSFNVEYQYAAAGTVKENDAGISYRLENEDGTKIKDVILNETKFTVSESGKFINATYKGVSLTERYAISVFQLFDNTVGAYYLVTNVNQLADGDHVTLFGYYEKDAVTSSFVPSAFASNNITGHALTLDNDAIDANQEFTVLDFVLRDTSSDLAGSFAFEVSNYSDNLGNYLYAAASSSNHIKTQANIDKNARFVIDINSTSHVASVVATESSNRSYMGANYNSNSPLFSCYAGTSTTFTNNNLYLYKWVSNADKVQGFIDDNMKMTQYVGDETYNKERCDANYGAAKTAFNSLTASQKALFTSEATYADAYARFSAWVNANGDTFDPDDGSVVKDILYTSPMLTENNAGYVVIIAVITLSAIAFGVFLISYKKKHQ